MAVLPDVDDVILYLAAAGLDTTWDASDISSALAAEIEDQASVCVVPDVYPERLKMALLRRVGRNLAARKLPLGMQDAGEIVVRLGSTDGEIRRYERRFTQMPMA